MWGRPRLTSDIDVTVRLGDLSLNALIEQLGRQGFEVRVPPTPDFLQRTRVVPLRHQPSGLDVDVVLAGPGLEDEFLARAISVSIGGSLIPVISAEDLIVTKVLAGRAKDLEDVGGVLSAQGGRLSLGTVRRTLAILESALGQSDLLPAFEAEVAKIQSR